MRGIGDGGTPSRAQKLEDGERRKTAQLKKQQKHLRQANEEKARQVAEYNRRAAEQKRAEEGPSELDFSADEGESLAEDLGYNNPEGVDKLISRIKVDS